MNDEDGIRHNKQCEVRGFSRVKGKALVKRALILLLRLAHIQSTPHPDHSLHCLRRSPGGAAVDPTVLEELLQPLLEEAQTSPNLMFFDRNIGEILEYPYPMSGGNLISPDGIQDYLDRRRIGFQCPHISIIDTGSDTFLSFETRHKETWLVCDFCGFDVCLNNKFRTIYWANDYLAYPRDGPRVPARSTQDIKFGRLHARERHVSGCTRSTLIRPRGLAATARSRRAEIGGVTRERRVRSTFGRLASDPSPFRTPIRRPHISSPSLSSSSNATWSPPSPTLLIRRLRPQHNAS
ncbi:hypothetical protein M422DRAFT_249873 [Sphaerobolus stellatus SS14]|uniref:Uncharacterized protein n=1 Tax=Sphaerobolus stellatus (strain SS14) TaxID=990650 RepID=A0A0C9W4V9_SPHS4|nr:hypothetical protein M422DRAFT_249873 [Sphaerobolus stellatus SS14]